MMSISVGFTNKITVRLQIYYSYSCQKAGTGRLFTDIHMYTGCIQICQPDNTKATAPLSA